MIAYTKNHNLGLEVPYRYGSESRKYLPDFVVKVDDGAGPANPLNLIVEIKGYRREDAKEKKSTMDTHWVPGVNHLGTYGRWSFAEFGDVYRLDVDLSEKIETEFAKLIEPASRRAFTPLTRVRNRSEASVRRHFGNQPQMLRFTDEIWKRVEHGLRRAIDLDDIRAAAAEASCNIDDALAVLALLSSTSVGTLEMLMKSSSADRANVSWTEFVEKLTAWWREKAISDSEWKHWASGIDVTWTPTIFDEGPT